MDSKINGSQQNPIADNNPIPDNTSKKRDNYLSWDQYFMTVACVSAMRSKDPHTQVGAVIVNADKKIVGIGYNGMPNGCSDDKMPWGRKPDDLVNDKHLYVCHAEMNAIMNAHTSRLRGCTVYVCLFPCCECSKLIIQAGICEVVFLAAKDPSRPEYAASIRLLDTARVLYRRFDRTAPAGVPALAADGGDGLMAGSEGALAVLVDLGAFASRIGEPGGDLIANSQ